MTTEDARRKIALLSRVSTDNGAAAAEAENAYRLQKKLMQRYAIEAEDTPVAPRPPVFRLHWSYWQELLEEFNLQLNHFGTRGSATVGKRKLYITLSTSQWSIEERVPGGGLRTTVREQGIESLRKYLKEHAPRTYTFLKR
ncbi:MAG: hypothetical protein WBQ86_24885 [Candidatus Binatus sp.]